MKDGEIKTPDPVEILNDLMAASRKALTGQYEVFLVRKSSLGIAAKNGRLDQVRRNDELAAAVRLIENERLGFAYTSSFSPEAVKRTVEQASAGARLADAQPELGLPDPPEIEYPRVDGPDPDRDLVPLDEKIKRVIEMEAAAKAVDARVERVRRAEYGETAYEIWMANSRGLSYRHSGCVFSGGITVKAVDGREAEMGSDGDYSRRLAGLDLAAVSREAARRAIESLGGKQVKSGKFPVLLENSVTAEFLGVLAGSFLADNVQKGKSLLIDKLEQGIMAAGITMVDDGLHPGGLATSPADGEGVPHRKNVLIDCGVLKRYLYDTTRARKQGVASTGNCSRGGIKGPPGISITNLMLSPGSKNLRDLTAEIGRGLLVTEVMGVHTANPISGDFSLGVSGQWIENGRVGFPVKGMAMAGNLLDLFGRVTAVGSDLRFFGSIGTPSLLISEMSLSGL